MLQFRLGYQSRVTYNLVGRFFLMMGCQIAIKRQIDPKEKKGQLLHKYIQEVWEKVLKFDLR